MTEPTAERYRRAQALVHDLLVTQALRDCGAQVLVVYLPVGSEEAARYYAQAALDAGVAIEALTRLRTSRLKKFACSRLCPPATG